MDINNKICSNPLHKNPFTLNDYKNWVSCSPKFTIKDYNRFANKKLYPINNKKKNPPSAFLVSNLSRYDTDHEFNPIFFDAYKPIRSSFILNNNKLGDILDDNPFYFI